MGKKAKKEIAVDSAAVGCPVESLNKKKKKSAIKINQIPAAQATIGAQAAHSAASTARGDDDDKVLFINRRKAELLRRARVSGLSPPTFRTWTVEGGRWMSSVLFADIEYIK